MTVLSCKQVLEDKKTRDASSITALSLNHKALSDVSCLSEFTNLERLDLSYNNLTSLEALKSCVNLKWLSVVQNKLQSLKGIEMLSKLTVLNAGKNKLKSMDEVRSLASIRALILNDNEIVSIGRLDQMKEFNTLVLSRNPVSKIGESLIKVKSITKLSLSNCQLQSIDSLKFCTELKELRLAHNDIRTLPSELACNAKLQHLDIGNNLVTSWSDIKVLSALLNLKNLNLQGNPILEKDKLAKKIRKLVPNLQIFNAKPIDKMTKNDEGGRVDSFFVAEKQVAQGGEKKDQGIRGNIKNYDMKRTKEDQYDTYGKALKHKIKKTLALQEEIDSDQRGNSTASHKKSKKKLKKVQENDANASRKEETQDAEHSVGKELKRKKDKSSQIPNAGAANHGEDSIVVEKEGKRNSKKLKLNEVNVLDDGETPFTELFASSGENAENTRQMVNDNTVQDINTVVTFPVKRKKAKGRSKVVPLLLSPVAEVGLGGPSTWDDL
ncbi:hypothetical protein NMG60_11033422 [Bertholletia excelsa]